MKPNINIRKASRYCCAMCDGPYSKYKKINRKRLKKACKNIDKKRAAMAVAEMDKDGFGLD